MDVGSILVTGATGFVGSHVVRRLVRDGARVNVLARDESSLWRIGDVQSSVTIWRGDVTDPDSIARCIEASAPEVVIHLAGDTSVRRLRDLEQIDRSIDVNLKGTVNVLKALERATFPVRCFVRAGGLEEYGRGAAPYSEDQRERPVSPYSAAQVAATHFCQMLQAHFRFPIVTLRPALVYGPAQNASFFIPSLVEHAIAGRDFDMTSGDQGRDLVYVEDVVEAFLAAAASRDVAGAVINIGSGREFKLLDVARTILDITGASIRLDTGAVAPRSSEIQHLYCRTETAARLLAWSPRVGLEEGLRRTVVWYRQHPTGSAHERTIA
jgi:nucleoside-diphosphate-sugar epimerase